MSWAIATQHRTNRYRHGGFALVELPAVGAICVLLAALLVIWGGDSRRHARLGQDLASLRSYGAGTVAYAADNADLMWGFSWKSGVTPDADPDLRAASNDLQAGANQAVQILRDRGGRTDIMPITAWIPHIAFSHLVLADYSASILPDHGAVSTGDTNRILWRDDPAGFDSGAYTPRPFAAGVASNADKRYPYSSSWRLGVAFFDRGTTPSGRVMWSTFHNLYTIPGDAKLGAGRLADVAFPSQKAMMFDEFQRHHGERQAFYGYAEARVPVLAVDGAVLVRTSGDGNIGWNPSSPTMPGNGIGFYGFAGSTSPVTRWYPMPLNGGPNDYNIKDRLMWTRGGLAGRDFDAPEVDTGQW